MSIPAAVRAALGREFGAPPTQIAALGTSASTATARCTIAGAPRLVKWELVAPAPARVGPCTAEVRGLGLLAKADAVRVPEVFFAAEATDGCPAFFVAEWIATGSGADEHAAGAVLGERLARQHRHSAPAYGLDHDNFCGASAQPNGWCATWREFYRERRLRPQLEWALAAGRMPAARHSRLEGLMASLDQWLPADSEPPALLHGDLWGGNWLVDAAGAPVLIDPAVYYGDREAELALCHMFGGFPRTFFAAYDAAWPPLPGRDGRIPLYQLYHLLNHLNMFGESYGAQVDAVMRRYVG